MKLDNVNKLLIIRFSSLGDVLLTTPLVRSLKIKYPTINISFLVKKEFADVYKFNPHLTKLFVFDKASKNSGKLIEELKNESFDLVIDLQNNLRSKDLVSKIGAKSTTFHKKSFAKFLLVNFKINLLKKEPQIPIRYAESIQKNLLDKEGLEIFSNSEEISYEKEKIAGLAPGSKHFTKRWPKSYFIELGKYLELAGYKIALFGGKAEKSLCAEIASSLNSGMDFSNNNDLFATVNNLKKITFLVCNDSGLMHLACAVNIPVVAIFGSSVKEFGFIPFRNKSLLLENNLLSCRPCSHIGRSQCPKKHFKCMMEILPAAVFEEIKKFVD